ncbi:MAG: glucosamine-6-phosphate deaminase [Microcella pacifica]
MRFVIADPPTLAKSIADRIQALLDRKRDAILGLATGSSPLALYDELVRRANAGAMSFSSAGAFLLDEYVGLPADHPQRYCNVIDREFTSRVDFTSGSVRVPNPNVHDLQASCAEYETDITRSGGIDFQILGVGTDGHIAFNAPGSLHDSRTRVVRLSDQTRRDNARFFDDDVAAVPEWCITQGIGTILDATELVVIAEGNSKAEPLRRLARGEVDVDWPVTALNLHGTVTVFADSDAARLIPPELRTSLSMSRSR